MARRRKTNAERRQEREEAEWRVWERFRPRMEAVGSLRDAVALVGDAPPPDSPGRRYYSNLSFFLQSFTVPSGSSYAEKQLYLRFIQRLVAAGTLDAEVGQRVQEQLRRAMEEQGPYA